jgi:hypothetical protein
MKIQFLAALVAGCSIALAVSANPAARERGDPRDPTVAPPSTAITGLYTQVPLSNVSIDAKSAIAQFNAGRRTNSANKAASDLVTVYRPLTPCRLVDTRGLGAAVAVAGPLAAGSDTNVTAAGSCGIPASFTTVGISMTIVVFNTTPGNGGFLSVREQGTAVTGSNMTYTPGLEWLSTTGNVSINQAGGGNFAIYSAGSIVHVIIDVNGYFQDLNELDSVTQIDFNMSTGGEAFAVNQAGAGNAIGAFANGGGTGLRVGGTVGISVDSGSVRAAGAGVNTGTFAFIHQVNTTAYPTGTICGGFGSFTVLDHPMLNAIPPH